MHSASKENQWQSLKRQIEDRHDLLAEVQESETEFRKFTNWSAVIKAFRQLNLNDKRCDTILRPLIRRLRDGGDSAWQEILTAIFWHLLCSIYGRIAKLLNNDFPALEDLWQDINWRFCECLHSVDIDPNEKGIAYRVFFRLKDMIRDEVRSRRRKNLHLVESDPAKVDNAISARCNLDAPKIKISARLSLYCERGILRPVEYEIIKSLLSGSETLIECAERLGINYEVAKKASQRAINKIADIEKSLSPFCQIPPPYVSVRRKHDRDADDEDNYYGDF
jgi:hypothetical protein